ncbi:MAG: phosphodiester glycosidase family protein [Pseudomonadota bacterium]
MGKLGGILLIVLIGAICLIPASYYIYAGTYGLNVGLKRGGTIWKTVPDNFGNVSPAMKLALQEQIPFAKSGKFAWMQVSTGVEIGELPVQVGAIEVDRILLTRLDPARTSFEVKTDVTGSKELRDWMTEDGAVAAVNGSYYTRYGNPDTPIVSGGIAMGPKNYDATHGAFVVKNNRAQIVDLKAVDWQTALEGADHAMVSYPLLVSPDKTRKVTSNRKWLANRTFVAIDSEGRVIFGTTKDAFFSLERLATFLETAGLNVTHALNLDGGPVSCHGVKSVSFERDFCGTWETSTNDRGEVKLLKPLFGIRRWSMPIALIAYARN